MADSNIFINRELSWLDFNARVLDEAGDKHSPLLERLKFIAIFSGNLDEFFMVRVAGLKHLEAANPKATEPAGMNATQTIAAVKKKLDGLLSRQARYLTEEILPGLAEHGVIITSIDNIDEKRRHELKTHFQRQIFPALTPVAIDPSHPFPLLGNGAIEIAVRLRRPEKKDTVHAFVEVPGVLPRFISNRGEYILMEDLIEANIGELFAGCEIIDTTPFRITRDMDFSIEEEGISDFLGYMEKALVQRRARSPIRLEMPRGENGALAKWLRAQFQLDSQLIYTSTVPLRLAQFFELVGAESGNEQLVEAPWHPIPSTAFSDGESMFETISREGAVPLCVPFQSFDPVVRLLQEAADDPDVLAIKQTLYRVSGNSPVVGLLRRAAENGKQVTVILELKARFDEGNNILWARRLEESGAHVVYGIAGLKIHCKALLIIRREGGRIKRYTHLATGNYNDKTAKLYTDIGVFMNDPDICAEVSSLFNVMTGYSAPGELKKLAAAPFNLRQRLINLIDREKRLSTKRSPGMITAKMNSLVDPEVIKHLHAAAKAGVKINLIIRGICCLKPDKNLPNLKISSIIDRYLEHTRLFIFGNNGEEEYYLASADWMPRNLDRRIEIMFPVEDPKTRKLLKAVINLQLKDKRKARNLRPSGEYTRTLNKTPRQSRSQADTYELFRRLSHEKPVDDHPLQILKAPPQ